MKLRPFFISIVVAACATGLAASALTTSDRFSYRSPTQHVAAISISAALAATAAVLAVVRARRSPDAMSLLMASALVTSSIGLWACAVVPALLGSNGLEQRLAWSHLAITALAAIAFLLAAVLPAGERAYPTGWALAWAVPAAAIVVAPILAIVAPARIGIHGSPGHLVVTASSGFMPVQAAIAALYGAAATGFLVRRSERGVLTARLGWALGLFAVSWLTFLAAPTAYVSWVSPGDLLRIVAFATLTAALAAQLRLEWVAEALGRMQTRLAREIHDGFAQDAALLVLLLSQREDGGSAREIEAARSAYKSSRAVLSRLVPD